MLNSYVGTAVKDNFSVLIPDGESGFSLSVLRCLSQITGLRTHILSTNAWALPRFSRHRRYFFTQTSGMGEQERLEAICHTAKRTKVDVILPVDQQTIRLLSVHGRALSQITTIAPVPDTVAFDIVMNKWLLAEWLKKEDIPCPATILYQNNKEFEQCLHAMIFPVLVKPTKGADGQGVVIFENPLTLLNSFKEQIHSKEYIVQSFIRGYDVDCSVLCQKGKILAYTIQKGFMDGVKRFGPPAGIRFFYDSAVHETIRRLIDRLKWSGIAHIDLRYDEQDGQVKILEINPRFWASLPGSLIAGVNFPYLACLVGLGVIFPKVEYQFQRFVGSKVAIRMMIRYFLRREKTGLGFDTTNLGLVLKDPFPEVFKSCFQV